MNPPSPVTSPAPKMPGRASSVAGSTFNQPRSVCANPVARHASDVGAAARGHQQPVGARPQLRTSSGRRRPTGWSRWSGGLLFDGDTWVADHQRDAVGLEVRPERGSGFRFLEAKERRSGFDHRSPWSRGARRPARARRRWRRRRGSPATPAAPSESPPGGWSRTRPSPGQGWVGSPRCCRWRSRRRGAR